MSSYWIESCLVVRLEVFDGFGVCVLMALRLLTIFICLWSKQNDVVRIWLWAVRTRCKVLWGLRRPCIYLDWLLRWHGLWRSYFDLKIKLNILCLFSRLQSTFGVSCRMNLLHTKSCEALPCRITWSLWLPIIKTGCHWSYRLLFSFMIFMNICIYAIIVLPHWIILAHLRLLPSLWFQENVLRVILNVVWVLKFPELLEHFFQATIHWMILLKVLEFLQLLKLTLFYHSRQLFQEFWFILKICWRISIVQAELSECISIIEPWWIHLFYLHQFIKVKWLNYLLFFKGSWNATLIEALHVSTNCLGFFAPSWAISDFIWRNQFWKVTIAF